MAKGAVLEATLFAAPAETFFLGAGLMVVALLFLRKSLSCLSECSCYR